MSKFLTELDVRLSVKKDNFWSLEAPLIYQSDILGKTITVPAGFQTDFASVPRVPIAYWFYGGRVHREAVVHDYLYRIDSNPTVSFSTANNIFLEAMKVRKKRWGIRYPMYWGVVVGGMLSYHKKKVEG